MFIEFFKIQGEIRSNNVSYQVRHPALTDDMAARAGLSVQCKLTFFFLIWPNFLSILHFWYIYCCGKFHFGEEIVLIGMIKWMHLSMEISFIKNEISIETNMKANLFQFLLWPPSPLPRLPQQCWRVEATTSLALCPQTHQRRFYPDIIIMPSYHHPNGNSMSNALYHHAILKWS